METEKSKKYGQIKLAHSAAAEAHAHAAADYAIADDPNRDCTLLEAAKSAVESTKEALNLSDTTLNLEEELLGSIKVESMACLNKAKRAGAITDGAEGGVIHDKAREDHEKLFRHYAILEHQAEMEKHQHAGEAAIKSLKIHSQAVEDHKQTIEVIKRIDEPSLMDTPEFTAFCAIVNSFDWTGTYPDDMYYEYVEPALSEATRDFAKGAGLEIPAIEDDTGAEERCAIYAITEAAYIAHLYKITNPQ